MFAIKPIVAFVLLMIAGRAFGQPFVPTDFYAARLQLNKSSADTSRVRLLVELGRYYNNKPALNDSALLLAAQAQKLSSALTYPEGSGLSYQLMAQAWCKKKDFKKSDELIKKAIAVFLSNSRFRDAAEAYLNTEEFYRAAGGRDFEIMIHYYKLAAPLFLKAGAKLRAGATFGIIGDYYLQIDKQKEAISALQTALALYKYAGNKKLQSVYDLLGTNYLQLNNYKEALRYAQLAVKTAEAQQDTTMLLCTIYNRTGMVYLATGQYEQANNYFKKAIAVAKKYKDKSAIYLSANLASNLIHQNKPAEAVEILKASEKDFPDIEEQYRIYYNAFYLQAYMALKKNADAEKYSARLLKTYLEHKHQTKLELTMLGPVIQYFISIRKYEQAAKYLPQFESGTKNARLPKFVLRVHLFGYQIDSARHNYISALQKYQKYTLVKDSIANAIQNKQMQELQVAYESEKKEKENSLLKKESLLQDNRVKQANRIRDLTLTGTVLLLIFVVLLYYSYRINQRNSKAIGQNNDILKQLVSEKEWLLKEIHHRVKNNLQIVMGLLQRQSAYIDNDDALVAIQNSENRMRSIALIHQKLYQSENLDLIFMPEYIDEMISNLRDSCGLDNRIFF
jgi:two-component sensor histidine kinase/tetratricopeptide (TPR) repeat protein